MRENRQYGTPLIVPTSSETRSAMRLERIQFGRKDAEGADYDERWLQEIIHRNPKALPIGELEPAYRPVIPVCTELPTPNGYYVDNFFVTPNGNLIFAECKLWRNHEARREAVAQVLDYIEGMSKWTCEDLDDAVTRASARSGTGTVERLFDLIEQCPDALDELSFNDAVSRNLGLGRCLFLIVGDGIREEAETLVDHVGAHPGLHFGLALVEIAIFRLPDDSGLLLQPRTVARTVNVERAVVRVDGSQATVSGPMIQSRSAARSTPSNLSEQEFLECLAKCDEDLPKRLKELLSKLDDLEVDYEFGKSSLILRFRETNGKPLTLGHVGKNGDFQVTNVSLKVARETELGDVVTAYLKVVAEIYGGTVNCDSDWPSLKVGNKSRGLDIILNNEERFLSCVRELTESIKKLQGIGP